MSVEQTAEGQRMEGEDNNVEKFSSRCIAFTDVSAAEDAQQVIVSTCGDPISATKVAAGVRASQWLGQISEAALQQLSQNRGVVSSGQAGPTDGIQPSGETDKEFETQHGTGYKLA